MKTESEIMRVTSNLHRWKPTADCAYLPVNSNIVKVCTALGFRRWQFQTQIFLTEVKS